MKHTLNAITDGPVPAIVNRTRDTVKTTWRDYQFWQSWNWIDDLVTLFGFYGIYHATRDTYAWLMIHAPLWVGVLCQAAAWMVIVAWAKWRCKQKD